MASTLKYHHELTNGIGKCSVPMWGCGCPSGFCDEPAYGKPVQCEQFWNYGAGEMQRIDGRYNGYVPGLACAVHGGPQPTPQQQAVLERDKYKNALIRILAVHERLAQHSAETDGGPDGRNEFEAWGAKCCADIANDALPPWLRNNSKS